MTGPHPTKPMANTVASPRYCSKRYLIQAAPCTRMLFLVGTCHCIAGEDSTSPSLTLHPPQESIGVNRPAAGEAICS
ncbi:hypothetical protein VULLAG_LOCUS83 [Vulpes lagopus]